MNRKNMIIFFQVIIIIIVFSGCRQAKDEKQVNSNIEEDSNFNSTGLPIVNKKITLDVVASRRNDVSEFEGMPFFDMIEEETNIHINWECIPQESFVEKKNLMFASGELPDVFYCCLQWEDIASYFSENNFEPLNEYIDKYSAYYKNYAKVDSKIMAGSTCSDGNIYALSSFKYFPYDNSHPALYVNKTWLNKLNVKVPKTTEDFYHMLKGFKDAGDINGNGKIDEIPFTFNFGLKVKDIGVLFGSFGYVNSYGFIIDEKEDLIYVPTTNEYKEGLKYFNKLYEEGLIDPEGFTQTASVYNSKLRNNPSVVGASCFWNLNWAFGEKEKYDYEVIPPLIGPNGEQKWVMTQKGPYTLSAPSIVITPECKNKKAAFRWGDNLYELDNLIQSYNGMYGICVEKQEDGTVKQLNPKEAQETTPQLYAQTMSPGTSGLVVTTKDMLEKLEQIPEKYEKEELNKFYHNYPVQYELPSLLFSPEESKIRMELGVDISEYVKQMLTKFITEGQIDERWDEYLNTLEKMQLDQYIEVTKNRYMQYEKDINK